VCLLFVVIKVALFLVIAQQHQQEHVDGVDGRSPLRAGRPGALRAAEAGRRYSPHPEHGYPDGAPGEPFHRDATCTTYWLT